MTIRHILLVLYGFIFAQCFFYLPINVVHTLYSSGPIFVLAIDYLINRIEITRKQMYGAICAFLGVLLTVNGHILYQIIGDGETSNSEFKHYRPEADLVSVQLLVSLILIVGTLGVCDSHREEGEKLNALSLEFPIRILDAYVRWLPLSQH